ncbi:MAG TPA: alpha amylase C-terminal domain-containing protein [Bryobacteraceae bacterium]|jgi:1,4-alpha-glucan branching enzyme|nr:alpha amylase C-terminal domain-containing protein [Bryobacteraceae bacterium]
MAAPQPALTNPPTGATVVPGGATFRIWAPRANSVHVVGAFNNWTPGAPSEMNAIGGGQWAGFIPGLQDGDPYLFLIDGPGGTHLKRDPRARLLTVQPAFPDCRCVVRDPSRFPWHETGFRRPAFNDLIVYQLHIGTYSIAPGKTAGHFLDVLLKLPYLADLGINAIEPLPIQEFPTNFSMGYNGTDYFSPENEYAATTDADLRTYLAQINAILAQRGQPGYASIDAIRNPDDQLRALVDVCHVYGIAILFDVVYNHAGGGFDPNSMYFLDMMPPGNNNDSLYFTDQGWAGGLVFAYWNNDVKQFLIDNARFLYDEYRIDGLRFDEVSVMDAFGGWQTCQYITETLHAERPEAIQIAEYWPVNDYVVKRTGDGGAGFDATWTDGLRNAVRGALSAASGGAAARVDMDAIAGAIEGPGLENRWRAVRMVEDHDIVYAGRDPRIAKLADGGNSRSWYARSRSRVAMGLVLTSPGIPMLFMGQEFLEDKQWSDTPSADHEIWWAGLDGGDKTMADFLRFTRELAGLRRNQPALRGEGCQVTHVHNQNRVLVFQRWVEGQGRDVMVAVSFAETNWYNYQIGFPASGRWAEVFNSDVYDNWVNPMVAGNGGGVDASGPPMHGLPASAGITIPANGFVVFARA